MVWHSNARLRESFHKQAPVVIVLPEINRSVHSLNPVFPMPFNCSVKKDECGFLVLDYLEKTYSSCWLIIGF